MNCAEREIGSALVAAWEFRAEDVLLHVLPLFHVHGLFMAINTVLAARAGILFLPRFEAREACALLPRVTLFMGVPTHYTRLLALTEFAAIDFHALPRAEGATGPVVYGQLGLPTEALPRKIGDAVVVLDPQGRLYWARREAPAAGPAKDPRTPQVLRLSARRSLRLRESSLTEARASELDETMKHAVLFALSLRYLSA